MVLFLGLRNYNAIFIEAGSSVILIDTLDTRGMREKLLNLISKIHKRSQYDCICTRPSATGAAQNFMDNRAEIIACCRLSYRKTGF